MSLPAGRQYAICRPNRPIGSRTTVKSAKGFVKANRLEAGGAETLGWLLKALARQDLAVAAEATSRKANVDVRASGGRGPPDPPEQAEQGSCAAPIASSRPPNTIDRLAPRIGEHSAEILREAGYAPSEIDELIAAGVTLDAAKGEGESR